MRHLHYCGLYFLDSDGSYIASAVPLEIAGKSDCDKKYSCVLRKKGVADPGRGAMLYKLAYTVCCIPPMMYFSVSINVIESSFINSSKHRITSKIQR